MEGDVILVVSLATWKVCVENKKMELAIYDMI